MSFKLIFKSPWTIKNSGTIITHIGAILLLLGGLFTALFSSEGYVDLAPGEKKAFVSDYHARELVLINENGETVQTFMHKSLLENDVIKIPDLQIGIEILEACRNCEIKQRRFVQENYFGMAQHMELHPGPLRHEDEENMAGLTFAVNGSENDGVYVALENVPRFPEISVNDQTFQFVLRKQQRTLPFKIELLEFKREIYPGTNLAKSYSSRVRIIDGNAQWESLIRMNEPLRYKGYTLFQSSFIGTPNGDVSVLAVVWNAGRAFPYISGIVMCIGMIIHLLMRRKRKAKTNRVEHAS